MLRIAPLSTRSRMACSSFELIECSIAGTRRNRITRSASLFSSASRFDPSLDGIFIPLTQSRQTSGTIVAPAGYEAGHCLIRPSQNCCPDYGYSFTLSEILDLSKKRYQRKKPESRHA